VGVHISPVFEEVRRVRVTHSAQTFANMQTWVLDPIQSLRALKMSAATIGHTDRDHVCTAYGALMPETALALCIRRRQ